MPPTLDVAAGRVAALTDIGPRSMQQDRAVAHLHSDGSWTIAVFDGLGGHERGDEAAHVAAEAFPARIGSRSEMHAAIRAANAAVWGLIPDGQHLPRKLGMPSPGRFEPLTTVAAAAWTPKDGLRTAWMGDSVLFFVPVRAGVAGMHSEPQGSWDSPLMDNALGFTQEPANSSIGSMPDDDLEALNRCIAGGGLVVIAATDGLFDPIRAARYGPGGRFADDCHDNSIGFAVPAKQRCDAERVAATLMDAARRHGLRDNAAVAVSAARTSTTS